MPAAHFVNLSLEETEVLIARALPVTRSVLTAQQWWTLIRDFFAMYYCCEPALHKVAEEVLDYLDGEHRGGKPGFPGFLFDLVHYEWAGLALAAAEVDEFPELDSATNLLSGVPVLARSLSVYSYDYPVHVIAPGFLPSRSSTTVHLALHRGGDDGIRWTAIDAAEAALLERIESEPRLTGAELGVDPAVLESLLQRGLIIGALREPVVVGGAWRRTIGRFWS